VARIRHAVVLAGAVRRGDARERDHGRGGEVRPERDGVLPQEPPERNGGGGAGGAGGGGGGGFNALFSIGLPLEAGTYNVKLTVNGKDYVTKVVVENDPGM
jgi:hypothetical protein